MKVTSTYLHLPPHLSTSWTQVRAIYLKQTDLVISLLDGTLVGIHGLNQESIDIIFAAHAAFLELQTNTQRPPIQLFQISKTNPTEGKFLENGDTSTFKLNFDNMESLTSAMQHNPAQANMPLLPKEVVAKIAEVAKIVAPEDIANMPQPVPNCNCPHCQIARAVHQISDTEQFSHPLSSVSSEEIVSADELKFQQWEIQQTGDKLFVVINRLDTLEKYNVFLGEPVGCTCGKSGCEHILAVLQT